MSRSERFSRFFAAHRHAFAVGIALATAFFGWHARNLEIFTQFVDLLPREHPYIGTYERYRGVYGTANTVLASVVAREGSIYQPDVLRAVEEMTYGLDSSLVDPEVNSKPASSYVDPTGAVAKVVHALVSLVDALVRDPPAEGARTGVEHNLTSSITHIGVRDPRVLVDGTIDAPRLLVEIPTDPDGLAELAMRVRRNPGVYGLLVSLDERAALVRASFIESRLDYGALFKHVRALERDIESRYPVDVFITGQPILFGWTYAFSTEILLVFFFTILISVTLLWAYFRRSFGVFLPLSGALVNVVWGLGFAALLGFNLDPLVLVVPMLITARAVSHSVQFVERFYEEYEALGDKDEACIRSMSELLLPGTMAILTDCIGLLTISLATIPLIEKLGLLCAFWAASIVVTEMLLNRLLILYLPAPRDRRHYVPKPVAAILSAAARAVVAPRGAATIVGCFGVAAGISIYLAQGVEVGEQRPGTPILYPDSEYNVASQEIGNRFFGLDELLLVAHSDAHYRVYAPDSQKWIESLQRVLETDPSAGGSLSYVDVIKLQMRLFRNNDPRWQMWPQSNSETTSLLFFVESAATAAGIWDSYRSRDERSFSIRVYYRDHKADTVKRANRLMRVFEANERIEGSLAIRMVDPEPRGVRRLFPGFARLLPPARPALSVTVPSESEERRALPVDAVDELGPDGSRVVARFDSEALDAVAEIRQSGRFSPYALWVKPDRAAPWQERPTGVWLRDGVELRLAAGTIGIAAAANDEIEASHSLGIAIVFLATFVIIVLSYRSLWVGLLLVVSLGTAALAAMAVQAIANIGVNVNTLPVQAIGVGIGVDYAIYIVDRILQERAAGRSKDEAIAQGIRTTGLAIAFTASTLVAGIIFWIPISSMRFSAEMSLLLSILMVVNALGAILLVPALLRLLPDRLLKDRRVA